VNGVSTGSDSDRIEDVIKIGANPRAEEPVESHKTVIRLLPLAVLTRKQ